MEYTAIDTYDLNEIIKANKSVPIVVIYSADWCNPCKDAKPKVKALCNTYNCVYVEVDIDEAEELAEVYEVTKIPTVHVFLNGVLKEKFNDGNFTEELESKLAS